MLPKKICPLFLVLILHKSEEYRNTNAKWAEMKSIADGIVGVNKWKIRMEACEIQSEKSFVLWRTSESLFFYYRTVIIRCIRWHDASNSLIFSLWKSQRKLYFRTYRYRHATLRSNSIPFVMNILKSLYRIRVRPRGEIISDFFQAQHDLFTAKTWALALLISWRSSLVSVRNLTITERWHDNRCFSKICSKRDTRCVSRRGVQLKTAQWNSR